MAAIEMTFDGTLYDKMTKSSRQVTLIGQAFYTGVGVGGGPSPGGPPLGFWGGVAPPYVDIGGPGPQPRPEHPIVLPPIEPGGPPVHPEHPIAYPPPPEGNKPPPPGGGWGYSSEYGWGYFPMGSSPSPKT